MATIRRIGFGTIFELEDSKVGIGTDAATHTLQALGNIRSEAATDIGISSLTTYQGFIDKEARFTTGQIDNQSQSGSTSGEIVIDGDVTVSSATWPKIRNSIDIVVALSSSFFCVFSFSG